MSLFLFFIFFLAIQYSLFTGFFKDVSYSILWLKKIHVHTHTHTIMFIYVVARKYRIKKKKHIKANKQDNNNQQIWIPSTLNGVQCNFK